MNPTPFYTALVAVGAAALLWYWRNELFRWWCGLRETIAQWLHANSHLKISGVSLVVLDRFDQVVVLIKQTSDRIRLGVIATDGNLNQYIVTTREVSREEASRKFPELLKTQSVLIDTLAA